MLKDIKKLLTTSITILLVPHSELRARKLRLPAGIIISIFFFAITGILWTAISAAKVADYYIVKARLSAYTKEFSTLKSSIATLDKTNTELSRLVGFASKEKIIQQADFGGTGSIDMEAIKKEMKSTLESVIEIKNYISSQHDIYMATPRGAPMKGSISSYFGMRDHPVTGVRAMHTGLDIRAPESSPVVATADGIVGYSASSSGNGNMIVIEHGQGYATAYAHLKENFVSVGQVIKKGQRIAASGSTGTSTGPHLHYEVWKNGKQLNPLPFLKENQS
ncbi:MAG: M23 family metallopeptidase [Syntrophorhabdus sp.]